MPELLEEATLLYTVILQWIADQLSISNREIGQYSQVVDNIPFETVVKW